MKERKGDTKGESDGWDLYWMLVGWEKITEENKRVMMKIMPMNMEVPVETEEDVGGGVVFNAGTGLFYLLLCSRLAS